MRTAAVLIFFTFSLNAILHVMESPLERLTHLRSGDLNWVEKNLAERGFVPEFERPLLVQYQASTKIVDGAEKSIFGLLKQYDAHQLARARTLLGEAMEIHNRETFAPSEAVILYAKLSCLLGKPDEALAAIKGVIALTRKQHDEAFALREALEKELGRYE